MVHVLSVLYQFIYFSSSLEVASFPEFVDEIGVLEIEQGRHPTVEMLDFVPNDTKLEIDGKCILLTGPNMGGKSTILRQVGLLTLLAHCGCAVPAESMRLSVVDRIFTRLGASDRLLKGESTFMVEMTETASILKNGTAESLMLIDELGRGTSTSDGTSIAMSVLEDLSARKIRTLFSTHYHKLANSLPDGCVSMHMQCHVEKNEVGNEEVVFLYQLGEGKMISCSYLYIKTKFKVRLQKVTVSMRPKWLGYRMILLKLGLLLLKIWKYFTLEYNLSRLCRTIILKMPLSC